MSKNGVALIVLFFSFLGLEATEEGVAEVISAIGTIISFVLMLKNQLDRPDVELLLWKKKKLDEDLGV